ncbi:unnamed protein product [Rhizoctonia solani]|uniref:Uncharacterized protein n=1 Tax=Rhizoctonia solani TaxID=456999 RepID=A0A8H3CZ28_9AGAM|nr:unnamed protein product [Rhizoctonia solani]
MHEPSHAPAVTSALSIHEYPSLHPPGTLGPTATPSSDFRKRRSNVVSAARTGWSHTPNGLQLKPKRNSPGLSSLSSLCGAGQWFLTYSLIDATGNQAFSFLSRLHIALFCSFLLHNVCYVRLHISHNPWIHVANLNLPCYAHVYPEIQKAIEPDLNARPAGQTQAQYDTLEAMAYIEQGLLESALTAWFAGPGPQSYPGELSHATPSTMREAIEQARRALEGKEDATVRKGKEPAQAQGGRSLLAEYPERNVLVIADELAKGCAEVLAVAAGATTRAAQVDGMPVYTGGTDPMPSEETFEERHELVRECTWLSQETIPRPETYVITRVKRDPGREYCAFSGVELILCLVRIRPKHEARVQEQASVVIECEVDGVGVEILDIAFFDDNQLLVILRTRGRAHIGMIYYRELGWIGDVRGSQKAVSREELMELVMRHHETNRMDIARLEQTIARSRELQGCGTGTAQLSVNGRRGRRTACVLDSGGVVEVLDMELEGGEEAESESERE